ncbi:hypothetical protein Hypma_010631 [Hypsizygus marmoreus]|uniref:F-box domain-containing protein n=1 Tax=Hypsizygus marmoreus TaxID=39966 RepID=A0A369JLU4_HYPMA|nr:hypothetical protein Hypma_010631 [Hypsizygus marmoreus]
MSLSLHWFLFDVHQFLEFLDSPTLQNLTLHYCAALNEDMISALSKSPSPGDILPRLKCLSIIDHTIYVEDEIVLNMIESRISQLEMVQIEGGYAEPEDFADRFSPPRASPSIFTRAQALKDGGLLLHYPRLTEQFWDNALGVY